MDSIPAGVSNCLYIGITIKIKYINDCIEWHAGEIELKADPQLMHRDMKDIGEAMRFYAKHCVLSYSSLEEEYESLKERYNSFMANNFPDYHK